MERVHAERFLQIHLQRRKFCVCKWQEHPKMAEIIWKFIEVDEMNYEKLRNKLSQFKNIFQYVYSNVYPEVHAVQPR